VLIDTAGIRRAGKIQRSIEYYSVLRAVRAIERADVALLLIDADEGLTDGDKRVGGYAHEAGKAVVMVVNKWDLAKAQGASIREFAAKLRNEMVFMPYAPIVFASAKEGLGVKDAVDSGDAPLLLSALSRESDSQDPSLRGNSDQDLRAESGEVLGALPMGP